MPSEIVHGAQDFLIFGKTFWWIHRFKDEPQRKFGPIHQMARHSDWKDLPSLLYKVGKLDRKDYESIKGPDDVFRLLEEGKIKAGDFTEEEWVSIYHEWFDWFYKSFDRDEKAAFEAIEADLVLNESTSKYYFDPLKSQHPEQAEKFRNFQKRVIKRLQQNKLFLEAFHCLQAWKSEK